MKKTIFSKLCAVLAAVLSCLFVFGACGEPSDSEATQYTIQYTDDTGVHSLSVESGALYSIQTLPEKEGYEFLGLFDERTGGTQYVDEKGGAMFAFNDNKNLVLFPQFKAKEYTLILDYQGAAVTTVRTIDVSYGSEISSLPTNLLLENNEFVGWYTQPNGKGVQVADQYGILPSCNRVNKDTFDLSDPNGRIYLYAAFQGVKRTVSFYFENTTNPEIVKVEHGTDIKDVVPETRVNGKAVLTWSTQQNDTEKQHVFTGRVTEDISLYAVEYAPVIDFDTNGGEALSAIVARAGDTVTLPVPTKENYQFMEWQDMGGNTYASTTMPSESITLKAVWQAKLVFDENGGTNVDDVSVAQGEAVTLPTPTREGYIFAGWYTEDKTQYTSASMPAYSVKLKAGWYKVITLVKMLQADSDYNVIYESSKGEMYLIDLQELATGTDFNKTMNYNIRLIFQAHHPYTDMYLGLYSQKKFSDGYLLSEKQTYKKNSTEKYYNYEYSTTITLSNGQFFIGFLPLSNTLHVKAAYVEIGYPDTETLYL